MEDPERMARDMAACAAINNSTAPPPGLYCEGTFDTWLCWPHTPANTTAYAHCPDFVIGFSPELFAHKECTEDGTWWKHPKTNRSWSNYTTCIKPEDDVSDIIAVYEAGYSVSLVALLISLGILSYFKSLRCARITVHMNLFASFALNNALWLAWYGLVVRSPETLTASPAWCRALNGILQYALLTNYTWMLCEGLYLHTVLVSAFVSERRLVRALLVAGWLLPVPSATVHAARRAAADEQLCWMDEGAPRPELAVLVCIAVLLNLAFLCNIVRVLCTKLRAGGGIGASAGGASRPSATALHALRATCLLAPLLGLQYLLTPFRPAHTARWWLLYEFVSALTTSLQGLIVAILYCFCNGEVLAQLRRRWRVLTFRPRANSTTNTTVSMHVLQFVRSAAPGAGEDKV
ncbi:calcitonin gene-related peptide type 1 receptor-like isoform X1 [Galleria mellonella]|uniref:Calcitonin gene-related peptide type 1 receptor-like isoform X1 n=1 Tax=Galleria mellonella TaxID=7137 RepID=A0ABM3MPF7_GALME|nr:calcitonin gene-related peptide type 1 receptor-like isoform X1 [Galleria mellonella]XP_052753254.1 calcitonin gene-related peptide type 1 receptor-like isoform X1 [Galleria mellonella]XP_052753255.1 calcitonin gene-related peptide type 1 receptor-like isoform X1 [Galleria mellonella]XP_052753256.1 calcitonin gene-related peptide type 1 receptor-like isoform X1 [Galleria mellonella]XP_052753257.1 calcitonin gene-related peptide type 1 receptor-like isoform X1 [Galleria mellonella]XP_0527532